MRNTLSILSAMALLLLVLAGCQTQEAAKEITEQELAATVPELNDLHEAVQPLWHDAYPEKDYALIGELLPKLDSLATRLDAVELPGILMHKQEVWDGHNTALRKTLTELRGAVEEDNKEAMLEFTEAVHTHYHDLVVTIRPMVEELHAFHQELYKLYHKYLPEYDLEEIRANAVVLREKVAALQEVELSERMADKQEMFENAVEELEIAVNALAEIAAEDDKAAVTQAVEVVHSAYQKAESVF